MDAFETLKRRIFEKRRGVVYFEINKLDTIDNPQINNRLDSYVESSGLHGIGPAWREVDASGARKIIVRILHKGLAYDHEEMPLSDAQAFANEVINLFSTNAKFYTNGGYAEEEVGKPVGWHPITSATFDTGVVFVDESQIGFIWIEDED